MEKNAIKNVVRESYFHLLALFVVAVFAFTLGWLPSYELNFVLFALILGGFGFALGGKMKTSVPFWLLYVALVLTVVIRVLPYWFTSVPLGYDPGLHKFLFEHPFSGEWLKTMYPLLFTLVMGGLNLIFGSWFLLVPFFIFLSALTGFVLYVVVKRIYGPDAGVLAALLFMVSVAQFETYWYNYYKNVIGIMLLLVSFLYFESEGFNWRLLIVGGLIAGMHQVAFFIFGITYFVYVMLDVPKWNSSRFRNGVLTGIAIILLALLVNIDRIAEFLLPQAIGVAESFAAFSGGAGSFFDLPTYFYYTLAFIPFAITGFLHYWRKNIPILIATLVCATMVLFDLFFHNRMIIYLDIFIIIFASLGFLVLMQTKALYGKLIACAFITLFLVLIVFHAAAARPLISDKEFLEIKGLSLPENATMLVTDKHYSPWIKGYVDANVVAPGLFDDQRMNQGDWNAFWRGERENYMKFYENPIYIHVGRVQPQFTFDDCFTLVFNGTTKLYRYDCGATP